MSHFVGGSESQVLLTQAIPQPQYYATEPASPQYVPMYSAAPHQVVYADNQHPPMQRLSQQSLPAGNVAPDGYFYQNQPSYHPQVYAETSDMNLSPHTNNHQPQFHFVQTQDPTQPVLQNSVQGVAGYPVAQPTVDWYQAAYACNQIQYYHYPVAQDGHPPTYSQPSTNLSENASFEQRKAKLPSDSSDRSSRGSASSIHSKSDKSHSKGKRSRSNSSDRVHDAKSKEERHTEDDSRKKKEVDPSYQSPRPHRVSVPQAYSAQVNPWWQMQQQQVHTLQPLGVQYHQEPIKNLQNEKSFEAQEAARDFLFNGPPSPEIYHYGQDQSEVDLTPSPDRLKYKKTFNLQNHGSSDAKDDSKKSPDNVKVVKSTIVVRSVAKYLKNNFESGELPIRDTKDKKSP